MRKYLVLLLSTAVAVGMSLAASPSFAQSNGAPKFMGNGSKSSGFKGGRGSGRGSGQVARGSGRHSHGGGHHHHGGGNIGTGLAVGAAAGLLGAAIGAAASGPVYYDDPPPPRVYRRPPGVYYDYDD